MQARARHFPLMDSMRAIAAIMILVAHCSLWAGVYADGANEATRQLVARMEACVAIFFIVSGFLLYRPFIASALTGEKVDNRAYAWRRFLRIVPAYWVALTIIALVNGYHYVFTLDNFWRYYGFAQIYSVNTAIGGITQAWTLCIEISFYAFLPIWAIGLRQLTRRCKGVTAKLRVEFAGVAGLMLFGFLWLVVVLFQWFRQAIGESEGGLYSHRVDLSFRWSMSWFIFSEVMFFGAFFTALWWLRGSIRNPAPRRRWRPAAR